jgi:hypothetical protein
MCSTRAVDPGGAARMYFWQTSVNNDMIFPARRGLRIMLSREYKQNSFSFMFDAPCQEDPRFMHPRRPAGAPCGTIARDRTPGARLPLPRRK